MHTKLLLLPLLALALLPLSFASTLTASAITPINPTIDIGQSLTLTANPSGTGPFTYNWFTGGSSYCQNDQQIPNATQKNYQISTASNFYARTAYYCYSVSNATATNYSPTDTVTVNPALIASGITPTVTLIDSSQNITLTANPSGGTQPYIYHWFNGTSSQNCQSNQGIRGWFGYSTITVAPKSNTYYCYEVQDGAGVDNFSAPDYVEVNSSVIAHNFTTAPNGFRYDNQPGLLITLIANASAGTEPYSYQWYSGSSKTCASDSQISNAIKPMYYIAPDPNTLINQYYCYKVIDSSSAYNFSGTRLIVVNSTLNPGSATPSNAMIYQGQSITLTANPEGGSPPYSYQWYYSTQQGCIGDVSASGATNVTYRVTPTQNSSYCYAITDNSSTVAHSGFASITVEQEQSTTTMPFNALDESGYPIFNTTTTTIPANAVNGTSITSITTTIPNTGSTVITTTAPTTSSTTTIPANATNSTPVVHPSGGLSLSTQDIEILVVIIVLAIVGWRIYDKMSKG